MTAETVETIGPAEHAYEETRIFGPPGTGKTTALSKLITRAVQARGSDAVMVCSFTRGAAMELVGRHLPVQRSAVATLHAHAYRAIGVRKIADGDKELIKAWNERAAEGGGEFVLSGSGLDADDPYAEVSRGSKGDRLLGTINLCRNRLVDPDVVLGQQEAREFWTQWQQFKRDTDSIDFTDMLEIALRDVDEAPGSPSVIFVDEAQDMTPLQLRLARKWGRAAGRVILAGDDDQCIYGFTGATPDAFLDPPLDPKHIHILGQSYRVPLAVLRYAEAWVQQVQRRQVKGYQPRRMQHDDGSYGDPVLGEVVFKVNDHADRKLTSADGPGIVQTVEDYLAQGKSVMILATTNALLGTTIRSLRREGIPFDNRWRRKNGAWNPLYRRQNSISTADRLLAFLRPRRDVWGADARPWTTGDLKAWAPMVHKDFGVFVQGARAKLEKLHGSEPTPWHLFTQSGLDDAGKLDLDWLMGVSKQDSQKALDYPSRVLRTRGLRGLMTPPQVTVGTIHSVKGGEADVVILFPDLSMPGDREWNTVGSEGRDQIVRQFYVGMTRARETLVVCAPAQSQCVPLPAFVPDPVVDEV